MVEDREHDVGSAGQRLADLNFPVVPVEPATQLEDAPRPRPTASNNLRTLAQLPVGRLGALAPRVHAGTKKPRHSARPLDAIGGSRFRPSAVILRIVSEPSLTCRWIFS